MTSDAQAKAIRGAASLVLVRDHADGPELFMLRRAHGAAFLGGAYVFAGGALDPGDSDPRLLARMLGVSEADANDRLGLATGALAYWAAAIRECFEEAGILLARDEAGQPLSSA